MKKQLCVLVIAAAAALGFLAGRNAPADSTQTVTVIYPEQWKMGDWRECTTGMKSSDGRLWLDCDRNARFTPAERNFDMSVHFSTKIPTNT